MEKRNLLSSITNATLIVCALVIVILVIRREFFQTVEADTITFIENWEELKTKGTSIGQENAQIHLIEFYDYECPYCKEVQPSINYVLEKYPGKISLTYLHFPLKLHEKAYEAAIATECAGIQNNFQNYHEVLFTYQDQLNEISFDSLAIKAGVNDIYRFSSCFENQETKEIVDYGMKMAKKLNITAIPTLLVNGTVVTGAVSSATLDEVVKSELTNTNNEYSIN